MEEAPKRLRGQYLKPDKTAKIKPKGNELQRVNLYTYSHNGKIPRYGGAI
jgi:hypothetical protein